MSVSSVLPTIALRPVALGLSLLAVTGGHAAYEASAKTIEVSVDGHVQQVRTHGGTVRDVLAAAHLSVGAHDLLAPAEATKVKDHSTVVLRRGRQIELVVDGQKREVWVTATSVEEALGQIGLRANGALLSADRSRDIPLKGFSLDVRTRKVVSLLDGGHLRRLGTNTLRVRDLLAEARVRLRKQDRLSVGPDTAVRDGEVLRITRIDGHSVGDDDPIPFATVRQADSSMYRGQTKVLREGHVGVLHKVYALGYVNGHLASKRLVSTTRTTEPVTRVVAYGTKVRPYSVGGADGLNWGALANCESGGNPRAVSSGGTYRGLYQFTFGSWAGVGGSGDPIDASSSEQTYRAKLLYQRSGRSAWPTCGRYL